MDVRVDLGADLTEILLDATFLDRGRQGLGSHDKRPPNNCLRPEPAWSPRQRSPMVDIARGGVPRALGSMAAQAKSHFAGIIGNLYDVQQSVRLSLDGGTLCGGFFAI